MDLPPKKKSLNVEIPDTSDKSTECDSPSQHWSSAKKRVNIQFEKMRSNLQGSLSKFSHRLRIGSYQGAPIETNDFLRKFSENEEQTNSKLKHKACRSNGGSFSKPAPSPYSNSPTAKRSSNQDLSYFSQDDFKILESIAEGANQTSSRETMLNIKFLESDLGEKCGSEAAPEDDTINKKNYIKQKSIVDEEDDSESSSSSSSSTSNEVGFSPDERHPVFFIDMEKDIEDLKNELKVNEDPDIHIIKGNFYDHYKEEDILGQGTSGVVKKCSKIGTDEKFAVKEVQYRNDDEILELIVREFKNQKKLNHKNIIKVYELYVDYFNKKIYTVMELAECKEMFEVIQNLGHYSEAIASAIFKQILAGINYLHLNGVCHRDLKPNNILVSKDGKIVKITDFNVSKFAENKSQKYSALSIANQKMWTQTGTIAYTAPEVFDSLAYTEAIDMWSAGVVLYMMLCGYQPFQSEYVKDLIKIIKEAKFEFHKDSWDTISDEAKDLIRRCLDPNPETRCLPSDALMHPWIANQGKVPDTYILMLIVNKRHSNVQTRPRGESSSKAMDLVIPASLIAEANDFHVRRRSSGIDSFDFPFYKGIKELKSKNKSKISKLSTHFDPNFIEFHPDEEESPMEKACQMKKRKGKNKASTIEASSITENENQSCDSSISKLCKSDNLIELTLCDKSQKTDVFEEKDNEIGHQKDINFISN